MTKSNQAGFTKLELRIMQAVWKRGGGTVSEVQTELDPPLAYTTVQTMLNILERKGKLKRELEGRAYVYAAKVTEAKALGQQLRDLVDRMFGGSSEELVMSLCSRNPPDRRQKARSAHRTIQQGSEGIMNTIESWILSWLLNSLWQVPMLFAAGWLAARALRPLGAAAEHRVWVGVLLAQTLLPACSTLPPELFRALYARFVALLAFFTNAHPTADSQVSVIMGSGTGLGALHIPPALLTAIAIAYAATTIYFAATEISSSGRCSPPLVLSAANPTAPTTLHPAKPAQSWAECLENASPIGGCGDRRPSLRPASAAPSPSASPRKLPPSSCCPQP